MAKVIRMPAGAASRVVLRPAMRSALAALLLFALAACAVPPPPPRALTDEEREEFRQEMLADIDKVDTFLSKTRRGANLSEITLGWFTMILLNELSARDEGLHARIHADDSNAEEYLRTNVRDNTAGEIAALEELSRQAAHTEAEDIRMAAREALACLTTIPGSAKTAETQAAARAELTEDLLRLKMRLGRIAAAGRAPVELPGDVF